MEDTQKNLFSSTVSEALRSTQSFLAFETLYLSRTSWLCGVNGIVAQRAQLVLKTRHTHHMHLRFLMCLKWWEWEGLLTCDWLWAGPLGWTPISNWGTADLLLTALPAVFHPKENQHMQRRPGPCVWAQPCSWGQADLLQKRTTDPN